MRIDYQPVAFGRVVPLPGTVRPAFGIMGEVSGEGGGGGGAEAEGAAWPMIPW